MHQIGKRRLGRDGPEVSALGLGCMGMSEFYGSGNDQESIATLHHALDRGVTFLDTADMYGPFTNEELVGRAIQDRRGEVFLATKFGIVRGPDGQRAIRGDADYIRSACEASLKRLGTDVIDVYFMHRVDPNTPIEETVGAMARLIEQGKVRWIGLCEAGPATLRRAHETHPLAALQTEYSLWARDCEAEILPACRALGIAYVAYAPLGRGLLTGHIKSVDDLSPTDRRRKHPRFHAENLARNVALVAQLSAMAEKKGVTSAQLALAWLLAQGDDIVPIPGTNHINNLELNVAAVDIALGKQELDELSMIFAPGAGAGMRYGPNVLKGVGI